MTKIKNSKRYDLEDRTLQFAKDRNYLINDATELMNIFGAILQKNQKLFENLSI
jgi:hypothetical protein